MGKPSQSRLSAKHIYQSSLFLLAKCLCVIYSDPGPLHPTTDGAIVHETIVASTQSQSLSPRWTSLWADCQKWYQGRPVEMQPILEIRRIEAGRINTRDGSAFPILLYTTSLALVANAVYHITSLLLLTHKPRLLKLLGDPGCFASHTWHAQSIAGIATSNGYLEQWDPILIAGLLLAAKEMTHESQQSVLLEQVRKITATTGIKLDSEIEALKSGWNVSRYDEELAT